MAGKEVARVASKVKKQVGAYHATGIEAAYNFGVPVIMPVIEGASPTVRATVINLEQSIANIIASPSEEERKRWDGKSAGEIRADIEAYVRAKAAKKGLEVR